MNARRITLYLLIALTLVLLAACGAPTADVSATIPAGEVTTASEPTVVPDATVPDAEETEAPAEEVTAEATAEASAPMTETVTDTLTETAVTPNAAPVLQWQGEIDGACHQLVVLADGTAQVGLCEDAPTAAGDLSVRAAEWEAIQTHFGPIEAETLAGTISFNGSGSANSDLWANALATWASFTAMELNSASGGISASAAVRTTLAWMLAEIEGQPGQCNQLLVMAYGYAYANVTPCEGGQTQLVAEGWLTDEELATFSEWVSGSSRIEDAAGYLDAQGSTPLDTTTVAAWAGEVHARLTQ